MGTYLMKNDKKIKVNRWNPQFPQPSGGSAFIIRGRGGVFG